MKIPKFVFMTIFVTGMVSKILPGEPKNTLTLTNMPEDIKGEIAHYITDLKDINSLCLVNKEWKERIMNLNRPLFETKHFNENPKLNFAYKLRKNQSLKYLGPIIEIGLKIANSSLYSLPVLGYLALSYISPESSLTHIFDFLGTAGLSTSAILLAIEFIDGVHKIDNNPNSITVVAYPLNRYFNEKTNK